MNQTVLDEETWLCQNTHEQELNLSKWLYRKTKDRLSHDIFSNSELQNMITDALSDCSLSFPEKLNDCNEIYFDEIPAQEVSSLQFDSTQPSYNFENIAAKARNIDLFQNVSPPSFVNSSTLVSFMDTENSFVAKNGSEIDYSSDHTMLVPQIKTKAMVQSACSPSLDEQLVLENLSKKVTFSETNTSTHVDDLINAMAKLNLNGANSHSPTFLGNGTYTMENGSGEMTEVNLNRTYQRNPKVNDKSFFDSSETYVSEKVNDSTITSQDAKSSINDDVNIRKSCSLDENSSSYAIRLEEHVNATYTIQKQQKETHKLEEPRTFGAIQVPNPDKLKAVADSELVQQFTSTPQVGTKTQNQLWECDVISPICNSDSGVLLSSKGLPTSQKQTNTQGLSLQNKAATTIQVSCPNKLKKVAKSVIAQQRLTAKTSKSNLKSICPKSKYTSSPSSINSSNLPVAQLLKNTQTVSRMVPAIQVLQENFAKPKETMFAIPRVPRARRLAGSPRTGIPILKPVSRIPGPRNTRTIANKLILKPINQ